MTSTVSGGVGRRSCRGPGRLPTIEAQGFGDMDDIMTGIDALVEQGIADPDRLGVLGWSYGGYLTAWIALLSGTELP